MMIDNAGIAGPVVNVTTPFRAPRAKVFKTWTDRTLIPKWFMVVPGYLPALAEVAMDEHEVLRVPANWLHGHLFLGKRIRIGHGDVRSEAARVYHLHALEPHGLGERPPHLEQSLSLGSQHPGRAPQGATESGRCRQSYIDGGERQPIRRLRQRNRQRLANA